MGNILFVVVATSDGAGAYWLTRRLGVDVLPVRNQDDGQYALVDPNKEGIADAYWEAAKSLHNSGLRQVEPGIPYPEKHELLAVLGQFAGQEVIPPRFVVKVLG